MRQRFVVGNWKMHMLAETAAKLAQAVVDGVAEQVGISVVICPPFPYLAHVAEIVKGSRVALGAQNLYPADDGAFTGEVSPGMLLDVGCKYVILGHSERRHILGESDAFINQKVRMALDAGLDVILCIGETLAQRTAHQTEELLDRQLSQGLAGIAKTSLSNLSVAYEPVWAIGNATHHATPEQAQKAHDVIRRRFSQLYDEKSAQALVIQYGGSVKPDNAASFFSRSGVDGALIGGASLHSDQFLAIIRSGICQTQAEGHAASRSVVVKV